jgi:hypothetical protein
MLRHIVLFKVKSEFSVNEKLQRISEIKAALEKLPKEIHGIRSFEVGVNELSIQRAYDFSILAEFESFDALEFYTNHPLHKKVVELIALSKENAVSVDFQV